MTETLVSLPSISRSSQTQSYECRGSVDRPVTQVRDAFSQPSSLGKSFRIFIVIVPLINGKS